jgi:hypothetical protein
MNIKKKACDLLIALIFLFGFAPSSVFGNDEGLFYAHFFLSDQTSVHYLEIDPSIYEIVIGVAEKGKLESVESIARKAGAAAAINGGFFENEGARPETPKSLLKINDKWFGIDNRTRGAIGWSREGGQALFDLLQTYVDRESAGERHSPWKISVWPQMDFSEENALRWNSRNFILGGTPLLVYNKMIIKDYSKESINENYVNKHHARTAVGVLPNNHWVFVVVDGKKNLLFKNTGITIPRLAKLMHTLGSISALNLDGGGSSTMVIHNEVVNTPCGEKYDAKGNKVREVANALLVIRKS